MNEFFSGLSNQHFVGELSLGVVFFRLFLAVVFGGLVGFERERKRKPAGFRTYILVCFGAAIVSMIQDQLRIHIIDFESTHSGLAAVIKTDLGRLGAQVISGIGFLGAGSIIKERGGCASISLILRVHTVAWRQSSRPIWDAWGLK